MAVVMAESGCRSTAVGDTNITYWQGGYEYGMSYGGFQVRILPGRERCKTFDIATNVDCAYQIYKGSGSWTPWSVYTNGRVYDYL